MTRIVAMCLVFAFGLAALPMSASAADLALVIGNSNYRHAKNSQGSVDDARAMRDALSQAGYDVIFGTDASEQDMQRLLRRFGNRIGSADKAVVFYSGLAVHTGDANYLAPVDMSNRSLADTMLGGVPLSLVFDLARRDRGKTVVFLDAAQSDGFPDRNIAPPGFGNIDPGRGIMVVSASAPRMTQARRDTGESRFVHQIMRHFLKPGATVADASQNLRQGIWVGGNVSPRLVLVDSGNGSYQGNGGNNGHSNQMSPSEAEAALNLSRSQRRDVQANLTAMGYDTRGIDGLFGPGTRTGIRLWQRANNLPETGYLSAEQYALLNRQANQAQNSGNSQYSPDDRYWRRTGADGSADGLRAYLAKYSDGKHADEARRELKRIARSGSDWKAVQERDAWQQARRSDTRRAYRDYLDQYRNGIWAPEARQRLDQAGAGWRDRQRDPQATEDALGLNRTDRLSVEQRLNYLGFPPGNMDGFFGSQTRQAIEGYQRSRGFDPTGYLNRPTLAKLMDETRNARAGIVINGAQILNQLLNGN